MNRAVPWTLVFVLSMTPVANAVCAFVCGAATRAPVAVSGFGAHRCHAEGVPTGTRLSTAARSCRQHAAASFVNGTIGNRIDVAIRLAPVAAVASFVPPSASAVRSWATTARWGDCGRSLDRPLRI